MGSIIGIPTTRVSDLFIRQRLVNQVQRDQLDLFQIQMQLSTGYRLLSPSDDSNAAMRIIKLQRLLERKAQIETNLTTNQSFLSATDTALSSISGIVADVRGAALEVLNSSDPDSQREAVAQQVEQAIRQIVDAGNQQFRGRYLFAGTATNVRPFEIGADQAVKYLGNEGRLSSYADVDLLFDTNISGAEVFGAISEAVRGTADLNPALTYDTRLADLNGGQGVALGSILISDNAPGGAATSTVDISSAETIADVAALLRANPPQGKAINVEVTPTGLVVELIGMPGDRLTIREVGNGTTADDLGILTTTPTSLPVIGRDLDPILRSTTRLEDILGTKAQAIVRSPLADNDLVFRAKTNGSALNGTQIIFQNAGAESLTYDPVGGTLTFDIIDGSTTANTIISLLAADPVASALFSAQLDPSDENLGSGTGTVAPTVAPVTMAGGSGAVLDQTSGLQIVNGDQTHVIDLSAAETVEDLLNILNMSEAGLLAEINEPATGIDVRSRLSGTNFMIGENGGTTATQLGLRTFTAETRLEDLNFGRGVIDRENGGTLATATLQFSDPHSGLVFRARNPGSTWNDFSIQLVEGVPPGTESFTYNPSAKTMLFEIQSGVTTASDLVELFHTDPQAVADFSLELDTESDPANDGSGTVGLASVTTSGGEAIGADFMITLADGTVLDIDLSANDGSGTVTATNPATPPETAGGSDASYASATVASTGSDNDLIFQARNLGAAYNQTKIQFQAVAGAPAAVTSYVPGTELVFQFDPGVTTAQDIVAALQAHPAANADFEALFDNTDGSMAETIGDVLTLLGSQDPGKLQAQLATFGNGIELVDLSSGTGPLTVTRTVSSMAAIGLGLIPAGQASQSSTTAVAPASVTFDFGDADPNNDLILTAVQPGTSMNAVQVNFLGTGPISFSFAGNVLDITYTPGDTAQDIITALAGDPLAALFTASLPPGSNGTAAIADDSQTMSGGTQTLTGEDVHQLETEGILTALLRLQAALQDNDLLEAGRAIGLLDEQVIAMNFARAELGARQQGLDIMQLRLDDEKINLESALSEDFDADLVEVISQFTARQTALEASLRSTASVFQMTLLNYL